jgi:hypothetical protein
LKAIKDPLWEDAMILAIKVSQTEYFRWHDSGDVQSIRHLKKIVAVAKALPTVKFWLPTRELAMVRKFAKENIIPSNLTIRLSATLPDKLPPKVDGCAGSAVYTKENNVGGVSCEAYKHGLKAGLTYAICGQCRACWNKAIPLVVYPKH